MTAAITISFAYHMQEFII